MTNNTIVYDCRQEKSSGLNSSRTRILKVVLTGIGSVEAGNGFDTILSGVHFSVL